MEFMDVLGPLGTAGAIVAAAVVLLRELKKLGNGGVLVKKLDSLGERLREVETAIARIEERIK